MIQKQEHEVTLEDNGNIIDFARNNTTNSFKFTEKNRSNRWRWTIKC